jgi:hypothetical protein
MPIVREAKRYHKVYICVTLTQFTKYWYVLLQIDSLHFIAVLRIPDPNPNFSIPDPGSKRFRIRIKESKYF